MTDEEIDLSQPYEHRHVHSFPSTMSSHTPVRNLSGCDDTGTTSTAGMTGLGESMNQHKYPPQHSSIQKLPATPEEVQLHFQFNGADCSPIPGIPDEDDLPKRPPLSLRPGRPRASRLPRKPTLSALKSSTPKKSTDTSSTPTPASQHQNEDAKCSFSTAESVSSSASAKLRRRPMPDMSAFELDSGSHKTAPAATGGHLHDSSTEMSGTTTSAPSPKLHCPPTPVRTPGWVSKTGAVFHRSNSLTCTRVLATCGDVEFPSMEQVGTASAAPSRRYSASDTSMDHEMDLEPSASDPFQDKQESRDEFVHPEAPPPIRRSRSVGEMTRICSFNTDFEVLGMLGKGAFADVYKVRSTKDLKLYAVKRNRRHFRGKRDRDNALAEVRSMQRLQKQDRDQKVPQYLRYLLFFYRAWQEDGHFFCQTELCCRDTCREMMDSLSIEWNLARNRYPSLLRSLPPPEGVVAGGSCDVSGRLVPDMTVWKICHDICAGLSHIRSRGLVHNDIKPSNIFFVPHTKLGCLCKIGDFGLAGEIGSSEDGQEGDQKFMAPELLTTDKKHSSADVFSLGLTLYEIAAGFGFDLPKEGPRWHELRSGYHSPELPLSRDTAIGQLIREMIAPLPNKRPTADSILQREEVRLAGSTCDVFLRDLLKDIDDFDHQEETRRVSLDHVNNDDQTPRNNGSNAGSGTACRMRVCSPTLGTFTTSHNLFTPEARSS